ncbi:M56 family metallopeptidase [Emticicia agri]|uniref:M56 family metallopeptidase n=1 Tax=Emticicia agri TaxID=2492393 RepID=A0A4Q5M1B0_9BACT|nr:M56 family metallopeptidase [Emticicia agri]RYU96001.1 M56 family metallopeptidase [Emticicia agri]
MILYLFKSTVCLFILWGIYKLFLESEKIHVFNRFYLLLSLVFAFTIPAINIEIPSATAETNLVVFKKTLEVQPKLLQFPNRAELPPIEAQKAFLWVHYVVILSSLVSLFFFIRFLNNLVTIFRSTRTNPVIKWQEAKLILLDKKILPYTFLNYIFISREYYENARIELELFSHELAHVRQKHSLDVIFIELLRIVFWFNPLLYLFKKAIQLNHEFLADEAVNKTYHDVSAYQYLLLSKAVQTSGLTLTSNLNFQLTKKRLLMMTKSTSNATAFIRKAICIPLFIALAFCLTEFQLIAQEPTNLKLSSPPTVTSASKPHKLTKEDVNYYNALVLMRDKNGVNSRKYYNELTEEEKSKNIKVLYAEKITPSQEEMEKWKDPKMYGVWINEKRVRNSEVAKYKPSDIAEFSSSRVLKNALNYGKHKYQLDIMTNDYYENVYIKQVKESPTLFIDEAKKKNN